MRICEECGSELQEQDGGILVCPDCGKQYNILKEKTTDNTENQGFQSDKPTDKKSKANVDRQKEKDNLKNAFANLKDKISEGGNDKAFLMMSIIYAISIGVTIILNLTDISRRLFWDVSVKNFGDALTNLLTSLWIAATITGAVYLFISKLIILIAKIYIIVWKIVFKIAGFAWVVIPFIFGPIIAILIIAVCGLILTVGFGAVMLWFGFPILFIISLIMLIIHLIKNKVSKRQLLLPGIILISSVAILTIVNIIQVSVGSV